MFDVKKLPATPGMARRLLTICQHKDIILNDSLAEMAAQDLLDTETIDRVPWKLDGSMVQALQHVLDWNGRAMLLDYSNDRSRKVALSSAHLRGGKTLIIANPDFFVSWAKLIADAWPDSTMSVFGNQRYVPKNATFPHGVQFTDAPDMEADFLITSYGGVVGNNLIATLDANQTIVEELDHQSALNYKWMDAVNAMFKELPAPLFIQNIYSLPTDSGRNILTSLEMSSSKAFQFIGQNLYTFLWPGLGAARPLANNDTKAMEDYLVAHGYKNLTPLSILSFYGVSSHLLDDASGGDLVFFDNTIKEFRKHHSRRDSGLQRLVEREEALIRQRSCSMRELVHAALDGDTVIQELIGALRTTQWSNLKAQHLKSIHTTLTNSGSRSLFLVTSMDLKRPLRLQFGIGIDDLSTSGDKSNTINRFIASSSNWSRPVKSLNNLIVSVDDLIEYPELLRDAGFLFMPEWPLDEQEYCLLHDAAEASGTRIVTSVLKGTHEEEIYKKLQQIS